MKCCTCKKEKTVSDFHKGNRRCKQCRSERAKTFYLNNKEEIMKRNLQYNKTNPWVRTLISIHQRCLNTNNDRFYCYGGRGIKCIITLSELKRLWLRDNAENMIKPSIDRKDNDGHYEYNNCMFIESAEHAIKSNKERTRNKKGEYVSCRKI